MNEITCDICKDLIPLVKDGIASEDSAKAVARHIETCGECRAVYGGELPPVIDTTKAFQKFKRKIHLFFAMLMMFGIFFGLSLTAGSGMFYNALIMPLIGILGYIIFRWRALYNIPVLLLITHGLTNILPMIRGTEHLDLYSLLMWTVIYAIFALLGVLIAGLMHFAFKKEGK